MFGAGTDAVAPFGCVEVQRLLTDGWVFESSADRIGRWAASRYGACVFTACVRLVARPYA